MNLAIGSVDLATLVAYITAVVAFGFWVGRGKQNLDSYLLGGRDLPWWAILGSIVATETSTATFLSVPGIAYAATGNLTFLQLAMGFILGRILVVFFLLPLYFQGKLITAYEVLEHRFGGQTKRVASLIFLVTRNLGDGLRLFLTAIVLEKVINLPLPTCVVIIGIATILYTVFGGMKSVVWNDCIQLVVYIAGGIVALFLIINRLEGGSESLLTFAEENSKFQLFDFSWKLDNPLTFWAGIVGGVFLTLGTHGTDQMLVQRYMSARSQRGAGLALILSGFVVFLQFGLFLLLGVALGCFYTQHPPQQAFAFNDQVFATFIVKELPANLGIIGLLLAAVFSAAMSTLSSSLNSSAAAIVNDFGWVKSHPDGGASDSRAIRATRGFTVLFGIVQMVVAVIAQYYSRSVVSDALAVAGFSAGLLLGLFALGVLTRHVQQPAALIGLLVGLTVLTVVKFGGRLGLEQLGIAIPSVAWPWLPVIGSVVTFAVAMLASLGNAERTSS